ncbi:hypothetical protein Ade02nite_23520 [Paractinoplanes deccanensis]|uniref:Secreted protein/lipoprotein n=1 Tax=Paractinoplanes deccanensis TaxID=113561 RepID=A0ABQ3Y127_9ACTN|nr:hypothetical protein [Actinoplanes deccanensis]GID73711.1 hypothetical protein Ade02nite_23520 [Actinoplanes deccanensis]
MFSRLALAGLAVSLLASACTGDKPRVGDAAPPVSSPATAALSPSADAPNDALAAYRGMWSVFVEAAATSDPESSDLRKYAQDQALTLITSSLYMDRKRKQVTKGDVKLEPKITKLSPSARPTEATIVDCVNDESWLKYKAGGGLVNDVPGGRHRTTATVKRSADGWKVSAFILKESGTC